MALKYLVTGLRRYPKIVLDGQDCNSTEHIKMGTCQYASTMQLELTLHTSLKFDLFPREER